MTECLHCNRNHTGLPDEMGHRRPLHYLMVPEEQRQARAYDTDDICVIDDKVFLVRAHLPVRVIDDEVPFGLGLWALVSEKDFRRYLELWDQDGTAEPPFEGWLSAELPPYKPLYLHPVRLHLGPPDRRPRIELLPSDNPLYKEQQEGITADRRHELFRTLMPWLFS